MFLYIKCKLDLFKNYTIYLWIVQHRSRWCQKETRTVNGIAKYRKRKKFHTL